MERTKFRGTLPLVSKYEFLSLYVVLVEVLLAPFSIHIIYIEAGSCARFTLLTFCLAYTFAPAAEYTDTFAASLS